VRPRRPLIDVNSVLGFVARQSEQVRTGEHGQVGMDRTIADVREISIVSGSAPSVHRPTNGRHVLLTFEGLRERAPLATRSRGRVRVALKPGDAEHLRSAIGAGRASQRSFVFRTHGYWLVREWDCRQLSEVQDVSRIANFIRPDRRLVYDHRAISDFASTTSHTGL